jgi:hypothetical protein
MSDRDHIPMEVQRAVLVEAGHRCAIPTCRQPTTEFAHIVPYAQTRDNSFENLIALCRNCHKRYDDGEIDRKAIRQYNQNLGILNSRYSDFERRVFQSIFDTGRRSLVVAGGFDILLQNAVKDGFLTLDEDSLAVVPAIGYVNDHGKNEDFPLALSYNVTDEGIDFVNRYVRGEDLS